MNLGFGNNVKSALAADITATQTVISVMPGTGNLFAALLQPDPALENHSHPSKLYAKVTLTDVQETVFEICHLTAVSADKLTVIRGQEGTAAKGWSLNNTIANFATRGSEDNFVQIEDLQNGRYLAATAGGTANALTVDLPSTFYLNGGNTFALHAPLLITPTLTNTGTSTLMLTLSGHVVGTYPLVKGNNTALQAGDLVAKSPFMAIFNTEQNRFLVMNPTTEIGVVRTVNTHGPDASGNVKLTAADVDAWTKAQAMRQIRFPGNSATRWLKIAEMTPQANGEARLEIMLSGMADYGALAQGMAVDQVFMTTRSANTAQRVTAATVGNFIQQTSLSRTANSNEYVVGLTEEVNGSGVTTRYDFWLRLDGFAGISSTMSLLNNTYTNVTVISDFTGANISTTAPTGIVYGKRARFYTTETKPTAEDTNAADVRNNFAARKGISRVLTGANGPTSPGVWSAENSTFTSLPYGSVLYTTNQADLSSTPGAGKYHHYMHLSHEAGGKLGLRLAANINGGWSGWSQVMMTSGGAFSGQILAPNFASTPDVTPVGAGTYAEQLGNQAPFFQPNWQWPVTSGGVFVPIAKGTSTRKGKGWPTAVSYGYLMPGKDMHAHPVIHALGDSGQECIWEFNTQNGGIHSKAGEFATIDRDIPPGIIHAWPGETPPPGWLLCNGSGFDKNACPRLAGVFPSGQVPDLRGVFLRAKDNGKGYDPNRGLLSIQSGQAPASALGGGEWGGYAGRDTGHTTGTGSDNTHNYKVLQETEQQRETRPVNAAINYIVRAA